MHNRLPAHRRHDERREQGGYRRADIARAKDPKSRASPLRRVEARDVGDARSECAARNPYADACEKKIDRKSTRLTPVTNAHLVCRLLLEKKTKQKIYKIKTSQMNKRHKKQTRNQL